MTSNKLLNLCLLLACLFTLATAQEYLTPRDCPKFETYLTCGPDCQTECATLNQPCLIRHIRCPDACYCNKGYARNAAGTCIPINQCSRRRPHY